MRKAISEVIVAVMLLMISVALIGAAYVFIMGFQEQAKSEVQQTGTESFKKIGSCLQTVSFDDKSNNLYVKNCGRYPIENVTVFIDKNPVSSVPINAKPNEIKNITISATAGVHEIKIEGDYASAATAVNFVDPTLVAYWSFNEGSGNKANDGLGNNNVGTLLPAGSGPQWVAGKFGKALQFNGVNNYVGLTSASLNRKTTWTWSAWVFPSNANDIYSEGNPFITFLLSVNSAGAISTFVWNANYPGNWLGASSLNGAVASNSWNFIAITLENGGVGTGTIKFYVNGKYVSSAIGQMQDNSGTIYAVMGDNVGAHYGGSQGASSFNGIIDEVRIWNRALSEEEIKSYMNAG